MSGGSAAVLKCMGDQAEYYNTFYRELARIDERHNTPAKIAGFLPPLAPGARIIDIGCGHGSVSRDLVTQGYEVYGMEINREAVESLREKGIKPVEHDITQPFRLDEKFDLVLILDVLEHLFNPLALVAEAAKILNDDGYLIITVPLYFDLLDRIRIFFTGSVISYDNRCYGRELYERFRSYNYDHIRFFKPIDLLEMCEISGLRVDKVKYSPMSGDLFNLPTKVLVKMIANRFTVNLNPGLLAHSMTLRVKK